MRYTHTLLASPLPQALAGNPNPDLAPAGMLDLIFHEGDPEQLGVAENIPAPTLGWHHGTTSSEPKENMEMQEQADIQIVPHQATTSSVVPPKRSKSRRSNEPGKSLSSRIKVKGVKKTKRVKDTAHAHAEDLYVFTTYDWTLLDRFTNYEGKEGRDIAFPDAPTTFNPFFDEPQEAPGHE